ncbi:hypothetical protein [Stutzerimonas urumqiensis]|uniref:hypothetical protein n=1 Tax=Stutzerimonas urumqiensis TaxID=638269 RepID=UPI000EACE600|nr:hypothetical protein [Stutzerimonas urumqiensis]
MNMSRWAAGLMAAGLAGSLAAQEAATLEQARERIGSEMVENRERIGREINAIRDSDTTAGNRGGGESALGDPVLAGDGSGTGVGVRNPHFDNSPTGITAPNEVSTPDDLPRPVTTPRPVPPDGAAERQAPVEGDRRGSQTGGNGTPAGNGIRGAMPSPAR